MRVLEASDSTTDADLVADLRQMVQRAAMFLPTQGPIEVFVYLNTLGAFESENFDDALKNASECYGAEPYWPEQVYRQHYATGRITDNDLEDAIIEDLGEGCNDKINGLGTRIEIRIAMLRHATHVGSDAEFRWIVAETDALERFHVNTTQINRSRIITAAKKWLHECSGEIHSINDLSNLLAKLGPDSNSWEEAKWVSFSLHLLWRACLNSVAMHPESHQQEGFVRPRDFLLKATGEDIDRGVHEVLIRFCAAYVDQGYSGWILPNRDQGFFESFLALYSVPSSTNEHWLWRLSDELAPLISNNTSAEQSVASSLRELGIDEENRERFIRQTMLSLGGWAGMIWQLESGVDWVVHAIQKGSLMGMLAVQLILEKHAILHLGKEVFGGSPSIDEILQSARERVADPKPMKIERRAFLVFQVAQILGWSPMELLQLTETQWLELSREVDDFSEIERRRIFHNAYENRYHYAALDAIASHATIRNSVQSPWSGGRPCFQIVTCIDDREESFRRHLEEVYPTCETFAAAGFFAVAMYYRGAAEGFYKPLCPAVVTPSHYVTEDVGYTFEGKHRDRAEMRRKLGLVGRLFHTRNRTFLGGMLAGFVGSLATIPLVARVLFPHLTSRIRRRFGSFLEPPPVTKLELERYADKPSPEKGHIGYSVDEMSEVVLRLLQDMGLTKTGEFSRLFIVCGHGSSSLNNPHESAYCCGACAGKRGGPNARAYAQMANDWRVRSKVAALGVTIPEDTFFVGAYHNTCDDSVSFYDLDRLPSSHRDDFDSARAAIEEARRRNAHERCRRFVGAPLTMTENDALRHVESRSQDISQPRPEYDHATNALCVVGRRHWSRGLFLDRRAFLNSYDSTQDDEESSILARILAAAIPVCSGINLSFFFSTIDNKNYGSGSKLPHNVVSLLGVMEGTSSDLRTGVYQQICEIHEPVRIMFVIETTPAAMLSIMKRNVTIDQLVRNFWVHLAVIDPTTSAINVFKKDGFRPYKPGSTKISEVDSSLDCYLGSREHLPFFSIRESRGVQ